MKLTAATAFPAALSVHRHPDRASWLAARRSGLGASDVPKILGVSAYGGPWSVWADRALPGRLEHVSRADAAGRARGHREEGRILEDLAGALGVQTRGPLGELSVRGPGPLLVTPDGLAVDGADVGGVECKTDRSPFQWGPSQEIARWTPDARRIVREDYAAQCYALLAATGWPWVLLAVRRDLDDLRWYRIVRDEDTQTGLVELAADWWDRHVVQGVRPEVDDSEACARALAALYPPTTDRSTRAATEGEAAAAVELAAIGRTQDALSAREALLKHWLADQIGATGHYAIEWPSGQKRPHKVNFQKSGGGKRIDWTSLLADHPELADLASRYTVTSPESRSVRVYLQESSR